MAQVSEFIDISPTSAPLQMEGRPNFVLTFHHSYRDYPYYHNHTYWEFIMVTKGSYRNHINGEDNIMNEGDAILMRPGSDHHSLHNLGEENAHLTVAIKEEYFKQFLDALEPGLEERLNEKKILKSSWSEWGKQRLLQYCFFIQRNAEQGPNAVLLPSGLLASEILRETIADNGFLTNDKPQWFMELLQKIDAAENSKWHVKDVLDHATYSHSQLSRFFKEYLNCSLLDYLTKVKMNHAHDYLVHSDLPARSIAYLLGYQSATSFSAAFKKYYGMPPVEYRNKHKRPQ